MQIFELLFWGVLLHFIGDYLLQSDWMAINKTSKWIPAAAHALSYSLPFLLITQAPVALIIISITHLFIDRYRLARHIVWLKNFIAPPGSNKSWSECKVTGYPQDRPIWLTTWLMFIADNTIHVLINSLALYYFGV